MIREIRAKTLVSRVSGIDTFFGLDYGMNLYRGCEHRCIYCDSRSRCYGIEHFDRDVLVKVNAIELLDLELARKRRKGVIGTGSMNDPYMPLERKTRLTRRALEAIAKHGFGVHVITKSDLVVRDTDLLTSIARVSAAVSFSITTTQDALARVIEPGAPPPSARFAAMRKLSDAGIETRVALMPTLPFIEDDWENVSAIITEAKRQGARTVIPWFGMTMRDRQRAHYYRCLDGAFPGLRILYEKTYGESYACPSPRADLLRRRTDELCTRLHLETRVSPRLAPSAEALTLFE
jgi:DNA repair photolyase